MMKSTVAPTLDDCRLLELPTFVDDRGTLTVAEAGRELPFVPARCFWITDVAAGAQRGGHAHRTNDEAVICLFGSVTVRARTPDTARDFLLSKRSAMFYLPPMVWIELLDFSADAVVLALASGPFSESDYIRDFSTYTRSV